MKLNNKTLKRLEDATNTDFSEGINDDEEFDYVINEILDIVDKEKNKNKELEDRIYNPEDYNPKYEYGY